MIQGGGLYSGFVDRGDRLWLLHSLFCSAPCVGFYEVNIAFGLPVTELPVGVFRVVNAVDEYGHFCSSRVCDASVRQRDSPTEKGQTDRFEQMAMAVAREDRSILEVNNTLLYSVQLAIDACRPRKVVGRVPRTRSVEVHRKKGL